MKNLKTFTLKSEYENYQECFFEVAKYAYGDSLGIFINSYVEGPICDLSTNITGDYGSLWTSDMLPKNAFFIKGYDGMPTIAKDLESKGLIKSLEIETYQGFGKYNAYQIEPKALRFMESNDVKNELIKYFKKDENFIEKTKDVEKSKIDDYFAGKLEENEAEILDEITKTELPTKTEFEDEYVENDICDNCE